MTKPLTVRDLHREAMELFDAAERARISDDKPLALKLYIAAQEMEQQAADLCEKEPSKSILVASAYNIGLRVLEMIGINHPNQFTDADNMDKQEDV